jgi:polyhydroxyalkanoate synthesis regulator protein
MEMFERAFTMFAPFARREAQGADRPADHPAEPPKPPEANHSAEPQKSADEIDDLKRQLEEVQKRLNRLSETKE